MYFDLENNKTSASRHNLAVEVTPYLSQEAAMGLVTVVVPHPRLMIKISNKTFNNLSSREEVRRFRRGAGAGVGVGAGGDADDGDANGGDAGDGGCGDGGGGDVNS